ncbi:MAG: VWA domain-containing protein [Phycisphaerales bacterium]
MSLRIEDPTWLWLMLASLPLALVALYAFTAMSQLRRWSAILARVLLLAVLIAALAGASSVRRTDKAALVVAIDNSGSVRSFVPDVAPDAQKSGASAKPVLQAVSELLAKARDKGIDALRPDDSATLFTFDAAPHVLAATAPARTARLQTEIPPPDARTQGSDLAAAIRSAAAAIPPDSTARILLVSDGMTNRVSRSNGGKTDDPFADAIDAARAAFKASKTPIDVLPLTFDHPREVIVETLDAPTRVSSDRAPVPLTLVITSINAGPVTGTLRLMQEGQAVSLPPEAATVTLQPGRNVLTLRVPLSDGRLHRFEASFEPSTPEADTVQANNRAVAFTTSPGVGRVLLVDGTGVTPSPAAPLASVLTTAGIRATVTPALAFDSAGDLLSLQAYDLIVLVDVPADALSSATQQNLARYVSDTGGGLLMVGGPPPTANSFGAGGWKGTPIEPLLPVTLDLPDRLIMPATAVVIILDSSGSMNASVMGSAASQQEIANRGAAAALKALDKQDLVGVIEFNSMSSWVVPLRANDEPEDTARKIMRISPGGGTNLPPALELAYEALQPARAAVKHVIVLSDGQSQGRGKLAAIEKKFRDAPGGPIKISSIAVGDDADSNSLRSLAVGAGGEFFKVIDPNTLPRIFVKAVRVIRTPLIREEPFVPAITTSGSPATTGVTALPKLGGVILTQPRLDEQKKNVQGVTYALLTPQGEPLLAHWRVGLGQVGAFTSSPAGSGWAAEWATPAARALWSQLARALSRGSGGDAADQPDLVASLDGGGDMVRVRVDVPGAGAVRNGPPPRVTLYTPAGDRRDLTPSLTAPGVYEASSPTALSDAGSGEASEGVYVVTVSPGTPGATPVIGGVVKPNPAAAEYHVPETSAAGTQLLRQIATETGGRVFTLNDLAAMDAKTLFNRDKVEPRESRSPLWPTLVLIAGGVLLLDIATRRIAWDRWGPADVDGKAKAKRPSGAKTFTVPTTTESSESDSPLAAAKRRARRQMDR